MDKTHMMNDWYKTKGFTMGPLDFPCRDANAFAIEGLLKEGGSHKRVPVTANNFSLKNSNKKGELIPSSVLLTASTADVDHAGDVILPWGIDLRYFRPNPVICWQHNYNIPPIGVSLWERVEDRAFKNLAQFAQRPKDHEGEWFPSSIYALIEQGVLKGVSVGIIILDQGPADHKELELNPSWNGANIIRRCALTEISMVTLGCNPFALAESVEKGMVDQTWLKTWGFDYEEEEEADVWNWTNTSFTPSPEVQPEPVVAPVPEVKAITRLDVLKKIVNSKPR